MRAVGLRYEHISSTCFNGDSTSLTFKRTLSFVCSFTRMLRIGGEGELCSGGVLSAELWEGAVVSHLLSAPRPQHHTPAPQHRSAITMASPNTTPRTLSRIENLPTELVQQIARYLIRPDYYRDHNDPHLDTRFKYISDGLLELRTTSAILKSKTEHVFRRLFTVKVVAFDRYSLFNLVKLSRSPTCSPLLRDLVFLDPWDRQYEEQLEDDRRKLWRLEESALDVVWSDPTLKSLESKHAPETALLITALKGLSKLKTVIISESMQPAYPASVRRSCLARHPPSMILLAALVGGTKLEHVVMSSCPTGDFDGVKPRIFAGHLNDMTTLSTLKTLDLNLTICNRE
jgi:hypothetical protein